MNNLNPLFEEFNAGAVLAGAGIGAVLGSLAGMLVDYFKRNRKLYKTAYELKLKYIKEHKNDYSNNQCRDEALAYISERNSQIEEMSTLIREKQEELHDLSQQVSMSRLGNLSRERAEHIRYKMKVLQNEIETLQEARLKCKQEMNMMKNYLLTKKWPLIRQMLVERDAEEFAAKFIRENYSYKGLVKGFFSGLSIGVLASVLVCLA